MNLTLKELAGLSLVTSIKCIIPHTLWFGFRCYPNMTFSTLLSALNWHQHTHPSNAFIHIPDTLDSDGNFLISHFVSHIVKSHLPATTPSAKMTTLGPGHQNSRPKLVFVCMNQIWGHYVAIARKLVSVISYSIPSRVGYWMSNRVSTWQLPETRV
jgi:hypothetical protein